MVLEKTLENPLDYKDIQPVHPKGDQSWVFIGRTDTEAETPILWPPHVKSWLIGRDFDVGRDWGQEEKETTEDEMAGWHHQFDGHEFEQTLGVGDGQGGLVCCDSWDRKESDMTEWLNWTELSCPKFIGICPLEPFYVMLAVHSTLSQFICLRHMRFKTPPPSTPLWASLMAQQVKESPWDSRDTRNTGWIPGLGRSPGEGNGNSIQYSCLRNPMDRRAWQNIAQSVVKRWTRLNG